jgi:uncharacterized membrane-anchored protein
MNKRNLILLGFVMVVLAQLAVPAWMILERERTLREGQVFKFKTQPVDPADAFRGRYVWLRLEPETVPVSNSGVWEHRQKAFAVLGTGTNGYAMVKRLERTKPMGEPALQVRVNWSDGKNMHINWEGLDRYYMMEDKAPAAETAYREHNRVTNQNCFISVRVRGSVGVIENLYIENQPIQAWLREHKGKTEERLHL